ncbi:MAG: 50S ribosomal protein L23 [DPANN group archaeon]|nr:50S ribosomal protein L23 [DPANN group archaeon]
MNVIKYPLSTEKSLRLMESENKLVFVVDRISTKKSIKEDLEKTFSVKIKSVNTLVTPEGKKKAYVKFSDETPAIDLATKLGLM